MWQFFKFGIVCLLACVFLFVPSPNEAESHVLPTSTKTRTASITTTSTKTLTPSVTITATASSTATATITPSPTLTLTPSATPVQKTEILLFENQRLWPGQVITSEVIDVSEYSKVSIFLAASIASTSGSGMETTCYFLPNGTDPSPRYGGYFISVSVRTIGSNSDVYSVTNGEVIGPKMVCDLKNWINWGSVKTSHLYLIP